MQFKRLFFDNYIKFEDISKRKLVLCIVIGLLSSFAIYSAFYILRETFRVISFSYGFIPLIFTENGRWLSNLFYAYLSLIFGNSVAISFLFRRPQSICARRNTKRVRILNEQVFLNLNFMFWFGKIAMSFGIMTVSMLDFEFFPEYYISFILLVLVMYLETWKTLLRVIKRKKQLYLFFHFLILSCLAFGLSTIELVDYKEIDKSYLVDNPIMDLPKSFFHDSDRHYYRNHPMLHFKLITDDNDNLNIIFEGERKIKLEEVRSFIAMESTSYPEELVYRILISISANKNLKLKHLKAFEAEVYYTGLRTVRYNVIDRDVEQNRFQSIGFNSVLSKSVLDYKVDFGYRVAPPIPSRPQEDVDILKYKKTIPVVIKDTINSIGFNEKEDDLVRFFEKEINPNTLFLLEVNSETSFQNYITVISAHLKAVHNVRQKHATSGFDISKPRHMYSQKEYEEFSKELSRLKDRFPTAMYESNK